MRIITKVETFDGKIHNNTAEAKQHVEGLYYQQLDGIAHKITSLNFKYTHIRDFIDIHLELFMELHKIKKDLVLQKEDDE